MARVLLSTSPWQSFHTLTSLFPNVSPLALQILAGVLRQHGHEVKIADVQHLPPLHKDFIKLVDDFRPDVFGITNNCMANVPVILRVARAVKQRYPGIRLIAGGQIPTFEPGFFVGGQEPLFDAVGMYEGENVIAELVEALVNGTDLSKVRGVAFGGGDGQVVRTPPAERIKSGDELPFPDWEGTLKKGAFSSGLAAAVETIRGCPFDCSFCSIPGYFGRKPRYKSADRIMEELRRLKALGVTEINFIDDSFGTNARIARELFQQMIDEDLGMTFGIQIRADVIVKNPDLIELGVRAGLIICVVGFEGYSAGAVRDSAKGYTVDVNWKASEILRRHGVTVYGTHIFGGPSMSLWDDILTFYYGRKNSDVFRMTMYTPLPGSKAFEQMERDGRIRTRDPGDFYYGTYVIDDERNPAVMKGFYFGLILLHYVLPGTMLKALGSPNPVVRRFNRRAYRGALAFALGKLFGFSHPRIALEPSRPDR